MCTQKPIVPVKKVSRKNSFFVGFAEFDEIEGPIISELIPENFPIDIETNYQIADYALYLSSKAIYEIKSLTVFAYPFIIERSELPRKVKKVAILIAFTKEFNYEDVLRIANKIESRIKSMVSEFTLNFDRPIEHLRRKILRSIYMLVKNELEQRSELETQADPNIEHEFGDSHQEEILESLVIVDLAFNVIVSKDRSIVEEFISRADEFSVIPLSRRRIAIVPKKILRYLKQNKLENLVKNLGY